MSDTITVAGTEFYIEDIHEVIISRLMTKAEETEDGTYLLTITEDDIQQCGEDHASDNPDELYSGTTFARLGYGFEQDRSVGYASVYDAPTELAGNYEFDVKWTEFGEQITSLRKVS